LTTEGRGGFEDLLALVQAIDEYWARWNQGPTVDVAG